MKLKLILLLSHRNERYIILKYRIIIVKTKLILLCCYPKARHKVLDFTAVKNLLLTCTTIAYMKRRVIISWLGKHLILYTEVTYFNVTLAIFKMSIQSKVHSTTKLSSFGI